MLKVITERIAVEKFHKDFMSKMESYPFEEIATNVGYPSGSISLPVKYYENVGLWFHWSDKTDRWTGANRYWVPLGLERPGKSATIKVEINTPYYHDRRIGGVYITDETEMLFIGHRGNIGGGRKGIGKKLFFANYSGTIEDIEDDGRFTPIAIISSLDDKKLLENIREFVVEIDRVKTLRYLNTSFRGFSIFSRTV